MNRRWILHPEPDSALTLSRDLKIHRAIAAVLLRRGFDSPDKISRFLNPSLQDLESPFVFEDMRKAAERILKAVRTGERILIYGDYDVDGVTASAVLYPILKGLGAEAEVYIPHRLNEGYGLNRETLERLMKKKYSVVITVDNGINSVDAVEFLNQKHADVIIVDHHIPKDNIPPAYAILSASLCSSGRLEGPGRGDENLAACGLAFKLGWALLGSYEKVEPYLDLVTVGTVADLAPVLGENRILLKFGLPFLSASKRAGLRALMESAGISRERLSYRDIAFGLGPRINASGRMGSPENAFKLLVTANELEAQNLAGILESGNRDRQRVEAAAFEEAVERVEQDPLRHEQRMLVLDSPHWHEGVLGIVAARLVERYQRPSIVIAVRDGVGKGSGRSLPHFSIFETVRQCDGMLKSFGGHAQACGLTIPEGSIPHFRRRLNELAAEQKALSDFSGELYIDAELDSGELDLKFLADLERLAPFGPGHAKPFFLSKNLRFRNIPKKRGKDTLHGWVSDARGKTTCEVVGFRSYERWNTSKTPERFDMVYFPSLKYFNGIASIQLELEDWR